MTAELTLHELLEELKKKRSQLPWEIGAFLVLEASTTLGETPGTLDTKHIVINSEGDVAVRQVGSAQDVREQVAALADILARTLVAAGTKVPVRLVELVEQSGSSSNTSLAAFRQEVEANLVPLNRQAVRRVVARMVREVQRQAPAAHVAALRSEETGQRDLDGLLEEADETVVRDMSHLTAESRHRSRHTPSASHSMRALALARTAKATPTPASSVFSDTESGVSYRRSSKPLPRLRSNPWIDSRPFDDSIRYGARRSSGLLLVLVTAAACAAAIAAAALYRRDIADWLNEPVVGQPETAAESAPTPRGDIIVDVAPEGAQVLLFVGKAPVTAENVSIGLAQEFLATAKGYSAARAAVPADATWLKGEGENEYYELAIQLAEGGAAGMAESALTPKAVGKNSGRVGAVRVVTTPPGALVYQLVGRSPVATLSQSSAARTYEFLVVHPERSSQTLLITPDDFREDQGKLVARYSVELSEK